MFYTDTNGLFPISSSTALIMLEIVMESKLLNEIDFELFKEVAPEIDSEDLDIF